MNNNFTLSSSAVEITTATFFNCNCSVMETPYIFWWPWRVWVGIDTIRQPDTTRESLGTRLTKGISLKANVLLIVTRFQRNFPAIALHLIEVLTRCRGNIIELRVQTLKSMITESCGFRGAVYIHSTVRWISNYRSWDVTTIIRNVIWKMQISDEILVTIDFAVPIEVDNVKSLEIDMWYIFKRLL